MGEEREALCGAKRTHDLYVRLYAAVAKDIAAFAQDYDADQDGHQTTIDVRLSELDLKMHNRDAHDEPLDELFEPTKALDDIVAAGWDPAAANATGWTMLHDFAGDETIDAGVTSEAIEWLLNHGANVNATNACGLSPLYLAAPTGFVSCKPCRVLAQTRCSGPLPRPQSPLYAARGDFPIPAGSTARLVYKGASAPGSGR